MCNQRTEKWVCKHCEKPVKEVTYLTSKCKSQSETGVCKEAGKACYETIDIYIPTCTPKQLSKLQTPSTAHSNTLPRSSDSDHSVCVKQSKLRGYAPHAPRRFWKKKSKKNVCESVKKGGICTQASPTLLDYVYLTDADCDICKQMN
ncbi:unnamed protein product [Fusarium graminearum]|uniref:Uncharacterized protein n=1 Tax=Gibberella zeae TaxID=5518 RepID=A0A9N8WTU8_GIBZA|nr:unnamed protein product [Fusarium graminearum]